MENRQFIAKMHQIAPNCVSNFKIFQGVTPPDSHPWGGGHSLTKPLPSLLDGFFHCDFRSEVCLEMPVKISLM